MYKYFFILFLLIFTACSSNNQNKTAVFKKEFIPLNLPEWLLELPKGDYEIGISKKLYDKSEEKKQAKEFATVNYNRNRNSVIINNIAKTEGEEISDYKKFQLNVSSSIDKLKEIYKSLSLVDSIYTGNYFIGLFSYNNPTKIKKSACTKRLVIPDWYKENQLTFSNGFVFACVKESSADLANAVNKAMEKARIELAKYKTRHIKVVSTSTYKLTKKAYTMETQTVLGNLKTTNIYIIKKIDDNSLYSYTVYLRMRGEK